MATSRTKVKIQSYTFKVVVESDKFPDGRKAYHAYVPALQSCRTWGYTVPEALKNLEEAAQMIVKLMVERGEPIPQETEIQDSPRITVNLAE